MSIEEAMSTAVTELLRQVESLDECPSLTGKGLQRRNELIDAANQIARLRYIFYREV